MDKAMGWAYAGLTVGFGALAGHHAINGNWLMAGLWTFCTLAHAVCCGLRFSSDRLRRQNQASIEDLEARARAADEVLTELERRVAARQPRGVKP